MFRILSVVYCLSPDNPLLLRWLKFSFASFISRFRSILVCHQAAEVGAIAVFSVTFRPPVACGWAPAVLPFSICLANSFAVVPTIVALRLRTSDRRGINEFRRTMRCHAPLVWLLHTFSGPTRTVEPLWMVLEERSGALGQSVLRCFLSVYGASDNAKPSIFLSPSCRFGWLDECKKVNVCLAENI